MAKKRILIVDDEEGMRHMLSVLLKKEGFDPVLATNGKSALEKIERESFDFVLSDIRMPEMDGITFLQKARAINSDLSILVMSAYGNVDTAIEAMKHGAYDYISKPFKAEEVILTLRKAEERLRLQKENVRLKGEVKKEYQFSNIVSKSRSMMEIFKTIQKIAEYKTTCLLLGESGTGKELLARAIHYNSARADKPFITVNCGAIPENLLESELFGHLKGSFTGAVRTKKGLFEEADSGTLFLDEIGELPLLLQVKLLRALQEEEIRRVGDVTPIKVDVRIVAATVKNLAKEVEQGTFREDLFYRLNVLPFHVPPLRERKEDIPLLVEHFISKMNKKISASVKGVDSEAMKVLMDHDWPGNVRELENVIERTMVLVSGDQILQENLPANICQASQGSGPIRQISSEELSIKKMSQIMEQDLIEKALKKAKGNRTKAAKLLEISHRALLYKIKRYKLENELKES